MTSPIYHGELPPDEKRRIASAIRHAMASDKLSVVAAITGIDEQRLKKLAKTPELMGYSEQLTLGANLS
jgi:thiamine monophosphate synthase